MQSISHIKIFIITRQNRIEMGFNKYILGRKKFNYMRGYLTLFSVQAVIDFGPRGVLLVKRKEEPAKGLWWIPGGIVFKTEDSRHAITRIVKRETGLKCKIAKQLPNSREIIRNVPDVQDGIADYITENFLVVPVDNNAAIVLDETSSDYKFITKISKDIHPFVRKHLRNAGIFKK